jgi:hypothetical protein
LELELSDLLDVVHSYRIDDQLVTAVSHPSGRNGEYHGFSRARIKSETGGATVPRSIDDEDPETWGTAPEQQAAQRAVMAMAGPPAPPRVVPPP